MDAQPGAIGAGEFDRYGGGRLGPGGCRRHFHKASGYGGRRHGRRGRGRHLFFEVCHAPSSLFGHARGRQGRGQWDGMIPERVGNAFIGVRPRLTPVRKLAGQLVELVVAMQRGCDRHHRLQVLGLFSYG